jgi:hypothetical protein
MSLADLKKAARDHVPKIKKYYIRPRRELIELLTMEQLPEKEIIEKKKIIELREEAKQRGFEGIWKFKKHELIDLLYPGTEENNQNNNHAQKHDNPK